MAMNNGMNNSKNEKKKSNGLGIPQTRGNFQMFGVVSGCDSERFYSDTTTKTGKPMRRVNFAVQYNNNEKVYVELSGMEQDFAYASKRTEINGKVSNETVKIEWKNRRKPLENDCRLIGVNVGIEQVLNESGRYDNKRMTLVPFDATEYLNDNLEDGIPVFVKGAIEYSEYNGKHYKKFVPNQISRMKKEPDFDNPEECGAANFNQTIVFKSIEPSQTSNEWIVNALVVGFNSVEETEFYIRNPSLANAFKKSLREYYSIKVNGDVVVEKNEEEIESADVWGRSDPLMAKKAPTVTKLVIEGAEPDSIDSETYSEDIIDEALAKVKNEKAAKADYGDDNNNDSSSWGRSKAKKNSMDDDDGDDAW